MNTNTKVVESRKQLNNLPIDVINTLCKVLITELGESHDEIESKAMYALKSGDYDRAKSFCLMNPTSSYLAAISCIASAYRSPMVADSVLRDAARHTCDVVKKQAEARISQQFTQNLMSIQDT